MDKQRKTRYLLAVYLIIASLAVIFALIGINYLADPIQSLALNLASEFLGVVLLFFIVNRLFALEEWELAERMENVVKRLEQHSGFLQRETKPLKDLIPDSKDISILGYSLVTVLRSDFVPLIESLKAGAKLRLLLVDPKSNAAQVILEHSQAKEFSTDVLASLQTARTIRNQIDRSSKGSIEVRLTTWLPSYGLAIINSNSNRGILKVVIYPPYSSSSFEDRIQFVLKRNEDSQWFNAFVSQFENLWSSAHQVDLDQIGPEVAQRVE